MSTRDRSKSRYVLKREEYWIYVGKRARPTGVMSKTNSAIVRRLDKLLDARIWKEGRDLTELEMFEWLRCRYPRLHEVMFRPQTLRGAQFECHLLAAYMRARVRSEDSDDTL